MFQTDASNTDSLPGGPATPGSKYRLERAGLSSDPSLAQDTVEVLLLRLKPDTQYKATVYPRAVNGAEGQPQATEFKLDSGDNKNMKPIRDFLGREVTCSYQ